MFHGKSLLAAIFQCTLGSSGFPTANDGLENFIRTDDVEIGFVLPGEGCSCTIFVHGGGTYSRDKVRKAVANRQVRNRSDDFVAQVEGMHLIHHRHRDAKTIRHAMIKAGKTTEISRLATY